MCILKLITSQGGASIYNVLKLKENNKDHKHHGLYLTSTKNMDIAGLLL